MVNNHKWKLYLSISKIVQYYHLSFAIQHWERCPICNSIKLLEVQPKFHWFCFQHPGPEDEISRQKILLHVSPLQVCEDPVSRLRFSASDPFVVDESNLSVLRDRGDRSSKMHYSISTPFQTEVLLGFPVFYPVLKSNLILHHFIHMSTLAVN